MTRSTSLPLFLAVLSFGGCSPATPQFHDPARPDRSPQDADTDADTDTDTDTDTDADTDTDTDADTDTDTDADTDTDTDADTDTGVAYDCAAPPSFNLGDQTLTDARAYHGISFDDDGNLIGWDGRSAVVRSRYDGSRSVLVPGLNGVEQIDRLPDGDFVLSDTVNGRLLRVAPDGASSALSTATGYVYGVVVGPDGNVYVADGSVHRVNTKTGEKTTLASLPARLGTIHSLNFNLDSTRMYMGTIGSGVVYYVDLDENLDPVGDPQIFAEGVGSGWHDAIGVDACGNVYVPDYYTAGLYRIGTDGTVTSMADASNRALYGHGLEWGSGIDGWRSDALYLPQPYNGSTVREVVIGIPDGDTVRTWNGEPVPW